MIISTMFVRPTVTCRARQIRLCSDSVWRASCLTGRVGCAERTGGRPISQYNNCLSARDDRSIDCRSIPTTPIYVHTLLRDNRGGAPTRSVSDTRVTVHIYDILVVCKLCVGMLRLCCRICGKQ